MDFSPPGSSTLRVISNLQVIFGLCTVNKLSGHCYVENTYFVSFNDSMPRMDENGKRVFLGEDGSRTPVEISYYQVGIFSISSSL